MQFRHADNFVLSQPQIDALAELLKSDDEKFREIFKRDYIFLLSAP